MPTLVLKLTDPRDGRDWWLRWSTITDTPTSPALPKKRFAAWLYEEETRGAPWFVENGDWEAFVRDIALPRLLDQVERHGTSYPARYGSPEEVIRGNRAGPTETPLSLIDLIDTYRREEP